MLPSWALAAVNAPHPSTTTASAAPAVLIRIFIVLPPDRAFAPTVLPPFDGGRCGSVDPCCAPCAKEAPDRNALWQRCRPKSLGKSFSHCITHTESHNLTTDILLTDKFAIAERATRREHGHAVVRARIFRPLDTHGARASRSSGSAPGSCGARAAPDRRGGARLGYTHVDTAQGYANEEAVGEGLAASGVAARRVFITTKVRPDRMARRRPAALGRRKPPKAARRRRSIFCCSIGRTRQIPLADTIRALNAVKRDGLARHIGLSNFTSALLDEAWRLTDRAVRRRADRVPPLSRPDARCSPRCARTAWRSSPIARSRSARSSAIR